MRKLLIAALVAVAAQGAFAEGLQLPKGVVIPGFFDKQGIKVLAYQQGPGGLHVWRVERNGMRTVLYTTSDNKALLSGVIWDASTGINLSDAFITPDMKAAVQATPGVADNGLFAPDRVPDAIKGIETLVGVKEGRAGPDKTLYVMFDPRCPHCHAAYKKLRQYVASGGTVKWIPVTVLGQPAEGGRLVADILQAPNPIQALGASMLSGKRQGATQPTQATLKAIAENEAYFFAAFDRNKSAGEAGVPVAFFATKQGVPQMVAGIDDDLLLQQIFADIKK